MVRRTYGSSPLWFLIFGYCNQVSICGSWTKDTPNVDFSSPLAPLRLNFFPVFLYTGSFSLIKVLVLSRRVAHEMRARKGLNNRCAAISAEIPEQTARVFECFAVRND
jgi:hypothetical protein